MNGATTDKRITSGAETVRLSSRPKPDATKNGFFALLRMT